MATGIIAEYNPFHNGHKYMLQQVNDLTHNEPIVVCISGSITQRGEMAILDKWQRAQAAVQNGANLVVELPTVFACRSGEAFGQGGVRLLAATGIVDKLAFGTEYPDVDRLRRAAELRPEDYPQELEGLLKAGHSYGSALSRLIAEKLSLPENMLREPNTILALEYLRAINKLQREQNISLTPLPIRRQGAGHNASTLEVETASSPVKSPTQSKHIIPENAHNMPDSACSSYLRAGMKFASGTAIRQAAIDWHRGLLLHSQQASCQKEATSVCTSFDTVQQFVPRATWDALAEANSFPDMESLFPLLRWQLLTASPAELRTIQGMGEGLEHKLIQSQGCGSYGKLVQQLATRRYPATRIQRLLIHLLLELSKEQAQEADSSGPLYLRVLAFNDVGRRLLKGIKEHSPLPIITKTADYLNRRQLENKENFSPLQQMLYLDILTTNLRAMTLEGGALYQDLLQSPIYVK